MNKDLDCEELTLLRPHVPRSWLPYIQELQIRIDGQGYTKHVAGIVVETSRESCDPMMVENLLVGIRSSPAHKEMASSTPQHGERPE